jgi:CRISPR-associated Csx10 family RAMP protein
MEVAMKDLKIILKIKSSVLVGGQTSPMFVDIAMAREPSGIPLIPASAIKGALRIEFERLVKSYRRVCDVSNPEKACGPTKEPCIACSVFGSPGLEGKLRFSDARLKEDLWNIYSAELKTSRGKDTREPTGSGYSVRHGVAISRKRKASAEQMLFALETLANFIPECTFEAEVAVLESLTKEELDLLKLAADTLNFIGADKSRGLGYIEASLQEVNIEKSYQVSQVKTGDLKLILIPQEYLRISYTKAKENFMDSFGFIPGSSVRGALAKTFVNSQNGDWGNDTFRRAFLKSPVLFSDFYPTTQRIASKPIPISAQTCKAYPGLNIQDQDKESHGSKDILIAATIVKKLREMGLNAVLDDKCCCGSPMKGIYGFYLAELHQEPKLELSYRTNTKIAISRSRMVSAEGQLYSYKFMDTMHNTGEPLKFIGFVTDLIDEFKAHLISLNSGYIFVGGTRYRGFGKVKIEVEELNKSFIGSVEDWQKRMETFTQKVKTPFLSIGMEGIDDYLFFSLTLLSDLILAPPAWSESLISEVKRILKIEDSFLKLENVIARTYYRGGYSDAMGIRKDLFPVVSRGSAFVFSCMQNDRETILSNLPELLREGMGARREEGFGRVSFCDPFHIERQEQS